MGRVGFEPTTNALKGHCSTIELPTLEVSENLSLPNKGLKDFQPDPS